MGLELQHSDYNCQSSFPFVFHPTAVLSFSEQIIHFPCFSMAIVVVTFTFQGLGSLVQNLVQSVSKYCIFFNSQSVTETLFLILAHSAFLYFVLFCETLPRCFSLLPSTCFLHSDDLNHWLSHVISFSFSTSWIEFFFFSHLTRL